MHTLTSEDIRMLRKATSITIISPFGMVAEIRAKVKSGEYTLRTEARTTVFGQRWYNNHGYGYMFDSAYAHIYRDEILNTIVQSLRPGDAVAVSWIANNNSDVLVNAGLVRDECRVIIRRGKTTRTYLVDVCIAPESARMVRVRKV